MPFGTPAPPKSTSISAGRLRGERWYLSAPPRPGGGLRWLTYGQGEPFLQRPDVIGQSCDHRRRPLLIAPIADLLSQGSDRPAEVVAVRREVRQGAVHLEVLTEAVRLARLPRVAVPVRPVLALQV